MGVTHHQNSQLLYVELLDSGISSARVLTQDSEADPKGEVGQHPAPSPPPPLPPTMQIPQQKTTTTE